MWYCEPFGDLQHMRPREILRLGQLDFTQCRLTHRDGQNKPEPRSESALRGRFD